MATKDSKILIKRGSSASLPNALDGELLYKKGNSADTGGTGELWIGQNTGNKLIVKTDTEDRLTALTAEVGRIEIGAGLKDNGEYSANTAATYIADANSLVDADNKLDAELEDLDSRMDIVEGEITTLESLTINDKPINGSPTLDGSDIDLTGYLKGSDTGTLAATDSVNGAFGKLENRIEANKSDITTIKTTSAITNLDFNFDNTSGVYTVVPTVRDWSGATAQTTAIEVMSFDSALNGTSNNAPKTKVVYEEIQKVLAQTNLFQGSFEFFAPDVDSVSLISPDAIHNGDAVITTSGTGDDMTVVKGTYDSTTSAWTYANVLPVPLNGMWIIAESFVSGGTFHAHDSARAIWKDDGKNPKGFDVIEFGHTDLPIVQSSGTSTYDVMSQKAVTDILVDLADQIEDNKVTSSDETITVVTAESGTDVTVNIGNTLKKDSVSGTIQVNNGTTITADTNGVLNVNFGDGIEESSGAIKVKINTSTGTDTDSFLQVDENGVRTSGITKALDTKVDDTQIVTVWSTTVTDTNIPSEKLVDTRFDTVEENITKNKIASDNGTITVTPATSGTSIDVNLRSTGNNLITKDTDGSLFVEQSAITSYVGSDAITVGGVGDNNQKTIGLTIDPADKFLTNSTTGLKATLVSGLTDGSTADTYVLKDKTDNNVISIVDHKYVKGNGIDITNGVVTAVGVNAILVDKNGIDVKVNVTNNESNTASTATTKTYLKSGINGIYVSGINEAIKQATDALKNITSVTIDSSDGISGTAEISSGDSANEILTLQLSVMLATDTEVAEEATAGKTNVGSDENLLQQTDDGKLYVSNVIDGGTW
jgi:hypothetical protein